MWIRALPPVVLAAALAACQPPRSEYVSALRPSHLQSFAETWHVRGAGDSASSTTLEVRVTPESIVSTVRAFRGDTLVQYVVAKFDPQDLRLREVRDSVPSRLEVINYTIDRLRGTVAVQNRRGTLDTFHVNIPIDSFTIDRRSLLTAARWLPLEEGRIYSLRMFDPAARTVYPLRIAIGARMTISGPTGRWDAYRVELTASPPKWFARVSYLFPTILWVRADSSRRILRIERPRIPAVYELTVEWPPAP